MARTGLHTVAFHGISIPGSITVSLIAVASAVISAAAEPSPVPNAEQRQAALRLVREVFVGDLRSADTAAKKAVLAKKLISEANDATSPANRYVLLSEAKRMATEAEDVLIALDVIDRTAEFFRIDPLRAKASTLWSISQTARSSKVQKAVLDSTRRLTETAISDERIDVAERLCEFAISVARKARLWEDVKDNVARSKRVEALKAELVKVNQALAKLDATPTDPSANLVAGRYYCFFKGDWDRGVPMLGLADDPQLNAVAQMELQAPTSATQQTGLADAWWKIAGGQPDHEREQIKKHALTWYGRAAPNLAGLEKKRVLQRISGVAPQSPQPGEPITASQPDEFASGKPIDLLNYVQPDTNAISGQWKIAENGLACAPSPDARLVIPIAIKGSYTLSVAFTRGPVRVDMTSFVGIPIGTNRGVFLLNCEISKGKYANGLHMADHKGLDKHPNRVAGDLTEGLKYFAHFDVKEVATGIYDLKMYLNTQKARPSTPFYTSRGPATALGNTSRFTGGRKDCILLGGNSVPMLFHSCQLTLHEGSKTKKHE